MNKLFTPMCALLVLVSCTFQQTSSTGRVNQDQNLTANAADIKKQCNDLRDIRNASNGSGNSQYAGCWKIVFSGELQSANENNSTNFTPFLEPFTFQNADIFSKEFSKSFSENNNNTLEISVNGFVVIDREKNKSAIYVLYFLRKGAELAVLKINRFDLETLVSNFDDKIKSIKNSTKGIIFPFSSQQFYLQEDNDGTTILKLTNGSPYFNKEYNIGSLQVEEGSDSIKVEKKYLDPPQNPFDLINAPENPDVVSEEPPVPGMPDKG